MKNKFLKILFCFRISFEMALKGLSKVSFLYFLGFFVSGLIVFSAVSSAQIMLSSGSVQYKDADRTFLLYFDDEKYLQLLENFNSSRITKRCYAKIHMQQLFHGSFSTVSKLVAFNENCADLVKGIPEKGTAVMKPYDMQRLRIHNGDKIVIDGKTYKALSDSSMFFEDAGVVIRNSSISGKSVFLYMFLLQSSSDVTDFHKELVNVLGCSVYSYDISKISDGNVCYTTAAKRLSLTSTDKNGLLLSASVMCVVISSYVVLNMLNIARYHTQKEHVEYALCRIFVGKKMATLQFFFETLLVSLVSLIAAWAVAGLFLLNQGVNGIMTWSPLLLLYALIPHCVIVFLLQLLALRNNNGKNIAECLTGFSN